MSDGVARRRLCPWDSPGKNTGVGCRILLQEDLRNPGIEAMFLALAGGFFPTATWEAPCVHYHSLSYHQLVDKQQHLNYKMKKLNHHHPLQACPLVYSVHYSVLSTVFST